MIHTYMYELNHTYFVWIIKKFRFRNRFCLYFHTYVWIIHMNVWLCSYICMIHTEKCMTKFIHKYDSYIGCMNHTYVWILSYILCMIHTYVWTKSYILCMNHTYVWIESYILSMTKKIFFISTFIHMYDSYKICMIHT